jgi:hypothetical protein
VTIAHEAVAARSVAAALPPVTVRELTGHELAPAAAAEDLLVQLTLLRERIVPGVIDMVIV